MRSNKFDISTFICPECGGKFPLPRSRSNRREKGHHKKLWCPFCKQEVNTYEIRYKDIFIEKNGQVIY